MADRPDESAASASPRRAFTARALLIGALGAAGIVVFAGFNDEILNQSLLVGNHFPIGAYFMLLALAVAWNPLWLSAGRRSGVVGRAGRRLALSGPELAVVAGMMFVACWAPTSGLGRYMNRLIVMPVLRYAVTPHWEQAAEYVPDRLFPDGRDGWRLDASPEEADRFDRVYRNYAQGVATDPGLAHVIGPLDWPWRDWLGMFAFWGPLVVCFGAAGVALAFLVHTQWARREQLAYPLATIADALIARERGRRWPTVFGEKTFLWAMGSVMALHVIRWLSTWYPDFIPMPSTSWYFPLRQQWASLGRAGWFAEGNGTLFFTIIGITYFLSSEIGLTLGLSQLLIMLAAVQFYLTAGHPLSGQDQNMMRLGAYAAYAVMFLWVGRAWYREAFAYAMRWRRRPADGSLSAELSAAAAAARTLAAALLGFWILLTFVAEVDWLVAGAFTIFLHLTLLVFMRLICETGLPFLNVHDLHLALARLAGYAAVGPQATATLGIAHEAIWRDPRECLPPYAATATELAAKHDVPGRRLLRWLAVTAVVAALAAWWVRNWGDYNWGAMTAADPMAHSSAPRFMMDAIATIHAELRASGSFDESAAASGLGRLALLGPEKGAFPWFAAGAAGVVALTLARYRWRWWPLHPALLLVWNTYPMHVMSHCFLIGWMVKSLVMQFGGGRVYQRLKPLFLGLVVGEIAIGGIFMLFGAAYYAMTGDIPKRYLILPQ